MAFITLFTVEKTTFFGDFTVTENANFLLILKKAQK
jgi:hypothetical protein